MSTFVSVGNAIQSFDRLIRAVDECFAILPQPVLIQYGRSRKPASNANCKQFLKGDVFVRAMDEAQLIIVHGGAGSLLSAIDAGKIPVVMTRQRELGEHIDNHQLELVSALDALGKIVWLREPSSLPVAAALALKLQDSADHVAAEPKLVAAIGASLARCARECQR